MSKQAALEYWEKCGTESTWMEEVQQALSGKSRCGKRAETVVKIGARRGYEFTKDEFENVIRIVEQAKSDELSDSDLEEVAGGLVISAEAQVDKSAQLAVRRQAIGKLPVVPLYGVGGGCTAGGWPGSTAW